MGRHRHDDFSKDAFKLWLEPLGDVHLDARIAGESRRGDVLFIERHDRPALRKRLGLLGKIAHGTLLLELFRNPPTLAEFDSCLAKRIDLHARALRAARRKGHKPETVVRPTVCVVTPSLSADKKRACGLDVRAQGGVYPLAELFGGLVIVVDELPPGRETLWLRLLGRGKVQRRAIAELLGQMRREPLADATMKLVAAWRESLPSFEEQTVEEREQEMNWQQVYARWEKRVKTEAWLEGKAEGEAKGKAEGEAKGLAAGEAKGKAEGKAEAVVAVLRGRGLRVTVAQEKRILACSNVTTLDRWLVRALTVESTASLLPPARKRR